MTAYIVFTRERLRDADGFGTYAAAAAPTIAGHAATPLAFYGATETLEGAEVAGAVIIAFPTTADARAWYDSPAYAAAREHRFKSSDYRAFITEGLPG